MNKPTVAFVAVRYKDNNEAIEQRFIKALEEEPDILEAHTIAGEEEIEIIRNFVQAGFPQQAR